jgi:hypothetical protein
VCTSWVWRFDPEGVAAALPCANPPAVDFRLGGFNLSDLIGPRRARLVRYYNMLRQYEESTVRPALAGV